jgi:hypothetical protein
MPVIEWNATTLMLLGLGGVCVVETIALALVARVKEHVIELVKCTLNKDFSCGLIKTSNDRLIIKAAKIDPTNTERWIFDKGGQEDGKRLQKGHSIIGSDRIDYAMFTEEGMESVSIRDQTDSELAGTSGYLQKTIDLSYDAGYHDGFDASHNKSNFLPWVQQNWMILVIFLVVGGIVISIAGDKLWTGPAGWQAANVCEMEKSSIMGRCAPYVDFTRNATATVVQNLTGGTGSVVQ